MPTAESRSQDISVLAEAPGEPAHRAFQATQDDEALQEEELFGKHHKDEEDNNEVYFYTARDVMVGIIFFFTGGSNCKLIKKTSYKKQVQKQQIKFLLFER